MGTQPSQRGRRRCPSGKLRLRSMPAELPRTQRKRLARSADSTRSTPSGFAFGIESSSGRGSSAGASSNDSSNLKWVDRPIHSMGWMSESSSTRGALPPCLCAASAGNLHPTIGLPSREVPNVSDHPP